jgi:hypothetical protein
VPQEVVDGLFDSVASFRRRGAHWMCMLWPPDRPELCLSAEGQTVFQGPADREPVTGILVEVSEDGRVLESRFLPQQLGRRVRGVEVGRCRVSSPRPAGRTA